MSRAADVIRRAIVWFAYEFLPIPLLPTRHTMLAELCRMAGSVSLVWVLGISLVGAAPTTSLSTIVLFVFAMWVALGIGTMVQQLAYALSAHVANWVGYDFERTGITLKGILFSDIRCSDGTWCRSELRGSEMLTEWMDWNGECHQIVFELVQGLNAAERTEIFCQLAPQSSGHKPTIPTEI